MTLHRNILPNQARINALLVLLRIALVLSILRLVFELFRYSMWSKIFNGVLIHPRQQVLVELIHYLALILQALLFVSILIVVCFWMYRAYTNLGQFERLRYSENMAVIGWFLPVFSWFGPFMIYSAIVKGYEEVLAQQDYIRRDSRRHTLKNWWWITWIAGSLMVIFSFDYNRTGVFLSSLSAAILMLSNLLFISSLSDTKMMEEGIGNLKNVTSKVTAKSSDDLLDDVL